MKRTNIFLALTVFFSILTLSAFGQEFGAQLTLFDVETDWIRTTYVTELNQPKDWSKSKYDYLNGEHYVRIEVIEKPTDVEVMAQVCFWEGINEMCAGWNTLFNFSKAGNYYAKVTIPYEEWALREEHRGNRVKFEGDGQLSKALIQFWIRNPRIIRGWSVLRTFEKAGVNAGSNEALGFEALDHIPIRYRMEYIVVAKGEKFVVPEHWKGAPESGSPAWNFYENK